MPSPYRPAIERFTEKFAPDPNGCWIWTAAKFDNGYGAFKRSTRDGPGKRQVRAHRWSYEHYVGPIPEGMCVMHTCDVPACVNPDHLRVGTNYDNVQDRHRKGRTAAASRNGGVLTAPKLNQEKANEIRARFAAGETRKELAEEYGVVESMIYRILRGDIWNR